MSQAETNKSETKDKSGENECSWKDYRMKRGSFVGKIDNNLK